MAYNFNGTTLAWKGKSAYDPRNTTTGSSLLPDFCFNFNPNTPNSDHARISELQRELQTLQEAYDSNTAETQLLKETIIGHEKALGVREKERLAREKVEEELKRVQANLDAWDLMLSDLRKRQTPVTIGCHCSSAEKEKSLQACRAEAEAKDKVIRQVKERHGKEVAAKDKAIATLRKHHKADIAGLDSRIVALGKEIEAKNGDVQEEAKLR
jgi:hypothetical protein